MKRLIELIVIMVIVLALNCIIMLALNQLFDTTLEVTNFLDHLALTVLMILAGIYFIG